MDFTIYTKVFFGENALDALRVLKIKKVFVVTDPFMVQSGAINNLTIILDDMKVPYTIFDDIVPDPPIEKVAKGVNAFLQADPDTVIGLGGGSAIDAAKAISEFALKISGKSKNLCIAIPTTSGTGSEVTSFAVISDKQNNIKYPLVSDSLLPDIAILDPKLVITVPKIVTADTGMDVLTHAMEAYVSTKCNDFSDALAEKAVRLVCENLLDAYTEGDNLKAREKIHNASCIAGMAFNNTSLGLNHGLAHALGAQFKIAHGRINSILLPHIIKYNANIKGNYNETYNEAAIKYANVAKMLNFPSSNIGEAINSLTKAIIKLQKDMKMPISLREQGILKSDLDKFKEEIAKNALQDATTKTNPRVPTLEEIIQILEDIY
ncbi:MAG: alcohol dehydrogenase [Firmicutes bacterium HGW-Firmicutes-1]|jgi:alcohol dehydrogenase class IV|nr:MAG: alcohol dehydrogenase [Firmicutes bacterium HGW-Firmicutes-1]